MFGSLFSFVLLYFHSFDNLHFLSTLLYSSMIQFYNEATFTSVYFIPNFRGPVEKYALFFVISMGIFMQCLESF
jgi:hypothetical protein